MSKLSQFAPIPCRALADTRMTPGAFMVLALVSSYTDHRRICWPSLATMGKALGISKQAISSHVEKLVDLGYLVRGNRTRKNGSSTSNVYFVVMDADLPAEFNRWPEEGPADEEGIGEFLDGVSKPGLTPRQAELDPSNQNHLTKPIELEPPYSPKGGEGDLFIDETKPSVSKSPKAEVIDQEFEGFWRAWKHRPNDPKDRGRKAYRTARKQATAEELLAAAGKARVWYESEVARGKAVEYIPMVATWLNGGYWRDVPAPVEKSKPNLDAVFAELRERENAKS